MSRPEHIAPPEFVRTIVSYRMIISFLLTSINSFMGMLKQRNIQTSKVEH